jgi:hypothetical protein
MSQVVSDLDGFLGNAQVKKDGMGRECSTNAEKRNDIGYWREGQNERDH